MTILEKIIENASKIEDKRKQDKYLLDQIEANFDEIPFSEIEKMFKKSEKDVEKLNKRVDKYITQKKSESTYFYLQSKQLFSLQLLMCLKRNK